MSAKHKNPLYHRNETLLVWGWERPPFELQLTNYSNNYSRDMNAALVLLQDLFTVGPFMFCVDYFDIILIIYIIIIITLKYVTYLINFFY